MLLLLLRHAKSSWKDPSLRDFERPLNARGQKAAEKIGLYISRRKIRPDLVISSPATRARETSQIMAAAAKMRSPIRYDQRLYGADPEQLIEVLSQIEDNTNSVILVGHNPGMEELLQLMTGNNLHMPTAALAGIRLEGKSGSEIAKRKGSLEFLIRPREILD